MYISEILVMYPSNPELGLLRMREGSVQCDLAPSPPMLLLSMERELYLGGKQVCGHALDVAALGENQQ